MNPEPHWHRRRFLTHSAAVVAAAAGATAVLGQEGAAPPFAAPPPLARIQARADRIIDISVCSRPFRAAGPRIEAERFGRQLVIHNYGHGGSGWSLSWGSAQLAVQMAQAAGAGRLAVIGCGAIGLTTAREAQRAGMRVRIVSRERPPEVASLAASGVWSPSSRLCTDENATPAFQRRWEGMARRSFRHFQSMLGLPGDPIEWRDGYVLSDVPFDQPQPDDHLGDGEPDYAELGALLQGIRPRSVALARHEHPFPVAHARRYVQLTFNLAAYSRLLMDDFIRFGGEIEQREFTSVRQFASLKERVIVNATGFGARALLGDNSLVPVRGQTAKLMPQPEINYGLTYRGHNLSVVARRDGLLVQAHAPGDWNNPDTTPNRALSEAAVARLAELFKA